MGKILLFVFLVILVVVFAVSLVLIIPVWDDYQTASREVVDLQEQLRAYEAEYLTLQQEIHDLEHNPAAITAVARGKFHLQYPNETVIFYNK